MKIISSILLVISSIAIIFITSYTLMHQKIKDTQTVIKIKSIEKATSNMTTNELSETFNINLNGKRHRLKNVYSYNENTLTLTLYLDGFKILNKILEEELKENSIEEIFNEKTLSYPIIDEEDLVVLKTDKNYLLVKISSNIQNLKEEYFVWNDERKKILENILVYDQTKQYKTEENIFYDKEKQILSKVEDNKIYVLEEQEENVLEEYVYEVKKDKATKELINTYILQEKKPQKG